MQTYEFTLKFRLPTVDADPALCMGALAAAGCDDAAIGIGQRGRIALDFSREAADALSGMLSAVQAVKTAIPGAELVEASPDFVGLTDVADLLGCSRQNIRKLMVANPATFPAAVHEGAQALWHLHPVMVWFAKTQKRTLDRALVEVSEAAMLVNFAKEAQRLPSAGVPNALKRLLA